MVMTMMRAGSRVVLIRMSPLTMTNEVRMGMAAMWKAIIGNVPRRVGLDHFRLGDGGHPSRTTQPSLVFTLLLPEIIILSIVRNGEITIMSGEGPWGTKRSAASTEGEPH